jgi:hypothetical protein
MQAVYGNLFALQCLKKPLLSLCLVLLSHKLLLSATIHGYWLNGRWR